MTNVKKADLPTHLGIIIDGNRRWARAHNLPTFEGHRLGYAKLLKMAYVARDRGVKFISAYTFSTENWSRSQEEVEYLMALSLRAFSHDMKKLVKDNFRIIFLGRSDRVAPAINAKITELEQSSHDNTGTTLALCFNYGGHAEIVDAAKQLADSGVDFTEENFAKNLYHPELPPCDLIVRTSGEQRLSGFQLWRSAYAEFIFVDKNWPDFTEQDFDDVLAEFARRSRRFGK
ncbi:MAG: polyprenyl diphosphate synthase [Candidatus Nanoperiomorbaceae bacterium]